jgi:hypothetical protein
MGRTKKRQMATNKEDEFHPRKKSLAGHKGDIFGFLSSAVEPRPAHIWARFKEKKTFL